MSFNFCMLLLIAPTLAIGMDLGSEKPNASGVMLREIVTSYLDNLESRQAAAEPTKDSAYFKEQLHSAFRHSVTIPTPLIKDEVQKGPFCLKENKGVLCAAHIVFIVNLLQGKVAKTINIPGKLEDTDTHRPTPCAVEYVRIAGMPEEQILLGELDGRVLVADPAEYTVKTFGMVPGKALAFCVDPRGEKIAVKYESKDEAGKAIPCFALAAAYAPKEDALDLSAKSLAANLAQSAISKRRSWAPPLNASSKLKHWSHFATQACNHEVRRITFEEDCCVTHCATGTIEKWVLIDLDTAPKLIKVAQIEQQKP